MQECVPKNVEQYLKGMDNVEENVKKIDVSRLDGIASSCEKCVNPSRVVMAKEKEKMSDLLHYTASKRTIMNLYLLIFQINSRNYHKTTIQYKNQKQLCSCP